MPRKKKCRCSHSCHSDVYSPQINTHNLGRTRIIWHIQNRWSENIRFLWMVFCFIAFNTRWSICFFSFTYEINYTAWIKYGHESASFHINLKEMSAIPALSRNLQNSICQGWKHNTHIITKSKLDLRKKSTSVSFIRRIHIRMICPLSKKVFTVTDDKCWSYSTLSVLSHPSFLYIVLGKWEIAAENYWNIEI